MDVFVCPNGCDGKRILVNGVVTCESCRTEAQIEIKTRLVEVAPKVSDPTTRRRIARR